MRLITHAHRSQSHCSWSYIAGLACFNLHGRKGLGCFQPDHPTLDLADKVRFDGGGDVLNRPSINENLRKGLMGLMLI